nr:MAG TPA: hypothetical protein [Caudoviricetes sp.]
MNELQKFLMGYQKNSEDFRQSFLILIEWRARI